MKLLLVLFAFIGLATAGPASPNRTVTLQRWSKTKVYEKCIGEARMNAERDWLKTNLRQCQSQPHPTAIHQMMTNALSSITPSTGNLTRAQQMEHETIRRTFHRFGNYTCLLRTMKFIDDNHKIQVDEIKSHMENNIEDAELRNGMKESIDDCYQFSNCAPERLISSVIKNYKFMSEAHIRQSIFFQCFRARMMSACVHKERVQQNKTADPQMGLALARIPRLDDENHVFADLFAPMNGEGTWFTMSG